MTFNLKEFMQTPNTEPTDETADHLRPLHGTFDSDDGSVKSWHGFETNSRISRVAVVVGYSPDKQLAILSIADQGEELYTFLPLPQLVGLINELQQLAEALDSQQSGEEA